MLTHYTNGAERFREDLSPGSSYYQGLPTHYLCLAKEMLEDVGGKDILFKDYIKTASKH
jgi:hypothetical protein